MKKMMMILVAVAAIGFTACNKTNTTDEQNAQTEQVEQNADEQKVEENAEATAEQDGAKADEATKAEENTEEPEKNKPDETAEIITDIVDKNCSEDESADEGEEVVTAGEDIEEKAENNE